jgi:hypothetical protein
MNEQWESRSTVVNRLTKPPSNVHSSCNLERTDAYSSGVDATESSPYKVKDDKVLLCQGTVVVGSWFGRESVIPSPRTGGPSPDTLEQFTGLLNGERGFVAVG